MLFRFSLYGFLKNQTYFEPFLALAFLEKGLSFFQIGLLIGFREVCSNIMEVPSGALADLHGRRRCMVLSMSGYIVSFLIFAFSSELWQLFAAMLSFSIGDAFRTGTHKAMIFDWLRAQGRENERTKVYGYTRSWSKYGSALSVLIAAALVFYSGRYSYVFLFAVIPYLINLVNLATYPKNLDGARRDGFSFREVARHLWDATRDSVRKPQLRRVMLDSMGYEGLYEAAKDYLQPLLKLTALAMPLLVSYPDKERAALVVGAVYFVLHLLSSVASRHSHTLQDYFGGEESATRALWWLNVLLYAALLPCLIYRLHAGTIVVFVLLAVAQNFWRPVLISRFDTHGDALQGATLLSLESQAKSLATMVLAPLFGFCIDAVNVGVPAGQEHTFWPLAVAGLIISLPLALSARGTHTVLTPTVVSPK
jgi:MFS family permease